MNTDSRAYDCCIRELSAILITCIRLPQDWTHQHYHVIERGPWRTTPYEDLHKVKWSIWDTETFSNGTASWEQEGRKAISRSVCGDNWAIIDINTYESVIPIMNNIYIYVCMYIYKNNIF